MEREIDRLEARIRELTIAFRRFIAGDLDLPPFQLQDEIEAQLRVLRQAKDKDAVDRFRLSNLEARFNSYRELYGRKVRRLEEGREARPSGGLHQVTDVETGVVVGEQGAGRNVEALYNGLYSRSGRSMKMDLDSFRSYIDKQVASIQAKTGCQSVQFRLVTEQGKVKLKAKPIGPPKGS